METMRQKENLKNGQRKKDKLITMYKGKIQHRTLIRNYAYRNFFNDKRKKVSIALYVKWKYVKNEDRIRTIRTLFIKKMKQKVVIEKIKQNW